MDKILPKISVIMPFYNAKDFLAQAVESILNQTFADFELIIINDASTDNSEQIIQPFLADKRIVYVKNDKNQGIVNNLNYGLKIAKAEIIARMDGDDVSLPTRLEEQFQFLLENHNIAAVGSFVKIIDENSQEIDQRTKPIDPQVIKNNLIIYSPLVHPATMFRKSIILQVGGYRNQYLYVEDIDLWYRLVYSGFKISNVSKFLLGYRYHKNSTANQAKANAKRAFKLRMETIKRFRLKISFKQYLLIYAQLIAGLILSGRQRQHLEGIYKKIVYHDK
ncbi:MAG: glycosyltransferase [Patescibacteria group bacterium]